MMYTAEAIRVMNGVDVSVIIYSGPSKGFSKNIAGIFDAHLQSDFPMVTPGDITERIYTKFSRTKFGEDGLPVSIKVKTIENTNWVEIWNNTEGDVINSI